MAIEDGMAGKPTKLQDHPLSRIIPPMSDMDFRALKEDIKQNGLLDAIALHEGKILDGRHRYKACAQLGVEPRSFKFGNGSPLSFVISVNLKRRHLTCSQIAMIGADSLHLFEKEAKKRQQEHRGTAPGKTLQEKVPEVSHPQARDLVSEAYGVNPRYIQDAKAIKKANPRLAAQIRRGDITVSAAVKKIRPAKISRNAHKPVRGHSQPQKKTAMELPHNPELAANTLLDLFDVPFLKKLVSFLRTKLSA